MDHGREKFSFDFDDELEQEASALPVFFYCLLIHPSKELRAWTLKIIKQKHYTEENNIETIEKVTNPDDFGRLRLVLDKIQTKLAFADYVDDNTFDETQKYAFHKLQT